MQTFAPGLILAAIMGCGSATASVHSTKWTLRNEGKLPVTISCRNVSVQPMEIVLPELTVKAGERLIHDWGDRFYNEGLWLNPGKWSCSLKAVDVRSHAQRTATFTTDWGEAVTLVFSRDPDQLRFRKIPVKAPLATQDAAHSKESK